MNRASTTCNTAGRKQVDPIVAYNQPTSAHMHDWYGWTTFTPTSGALSVGINPAHPEDPGYGPLASSCLFYGDWPLYWFPSPKFNGTLIAVGGPLKSTFQAPAGVQVETPPFGMNVIAGSSTATTPQPHIRFTCGDIDGVSADHPIDCTGIPGGVVTAEATFPDCWDGKIGYSYPPGGDAGKMYDTPTGLSPSHFSYSVDGKCGDGMIPCVPGKFIAQLVTQQQFTDPRTNAPMVNPNNADGSLALSFSSGDYKTYHADYIDLWNGQLGAIVNQCLNHPAVQGQGCPPGTYIGTVHPTHRLS